MFTSCSMLRKLSNEGLNFKKMKYIIVVFILIMGCKKECKDCKTEVVYYEVSSNLRVGGSTINEEVCDDEVNGFEKSEQVTYRNYKCIKVTKRDCE